jgi:hypothetical protein
MRASSCFVALALTFTLSGCLPTAASINALTQAAKAQGNAQTEPGKTGDGTKEPAKPVETTGDTPSTKPSTAPAADDESVKAVEAFQVKVDAAKDDARAIAKLFIAGMVAYEKDAKLGRALMTLTVIESDLVPSKDSPSGFAFFNAREIYLRTLDRNTKLGRAYLDSPPAADGADVETHVMIDDDYAAVEKGVNEEAGTAKFYMKLNDELGAGKRPRPLSLKKVDGVWRVSEYSSVFVQI